MAGKGSLALAREGITVLWAFPSPGDAALPAARGPAGVSLGSLLDDQHWHAVRLQRAGGLVNLTVDEQRRRFHARGEFSHLDLAPEVRCSCFR